jgi:hypothetical protein
MTACREKKDESNSPPLRSSSLGMDDDMSFMAELEKKDVEKQKTNENAMRIE